jgi:biopolymer transport protein ExbD
MSKSMVPLIDLVFLTLGSVLAAMTQMETVEALDIEVARVGTGQAIVQRGELAVVTVTEAGLTMEGQVIEPDEVAARIGPEKVILRAQRALATERTLQALGDLTQRGLNVVLEVTTDRQATAPNEGSR